MAARVDESEADRLAREEHIIATFASQKEQHAHAKDISVRDVTISFHGANLIENTDFALNYGNRYGFIGPNGAGKSTIMKAIAARCLADPEKVSISSFWTRSTRRRIRRRSTRSSRSDDETEIFKRPSIFGVSRRSAVWSLDRSWPSQFELKTVPRQRADSARSESIVTRPLAGSMSTRSTTSARPSRPRPRRSTTRRGLRRGRPGTIEPETASFV